MLCKPFRFLSLLAVGLCLALVHAQTFAEELDENSSKAEVQFQLAKKYFDGEGVDKNPAKAFAFMEKAARQGYPIAQAGLGYFYATGIGTPMNEEAAVEWFRKSADQGYQKAQLNLGQMIRSGKGTAKNPDEGMAWIEKASKSGLAEAKFTLGEIYFVGDDQISPDYQKAHILLLELAEAGFPKAQNLMGVAYRDGLGVKTDSAKAEEWFFKAAMQGDAKAQSNLGHLIGVANADPARRTNALKWILLASAQGEVTSTRTLSELTPNLSPALLARARRDASALKKTIPQTN